LGASVGVKPAWSAFRARILTALEAVPEGQLVKADEREPVLRWRDGPGESTLARAVGEVTGWEYSLWQPELDDEASTVWLDRAFSTEALAVAVIRYRASHPLPYDSSRDTARADLRQILDTDAPARSGYPLTDAMATFLLEEADPPGVALDDAPTRADRLAQKLTALGYDDLWNRAYAGVEI
jgi:hypothetical protein